jgi:DNA repair ATPase RecN
MDLERAKFDRSWAEFDMDFIDDSDEGRTKALARAMKRAEDAEAEIQRLTQERDEQREKLDQLLQQLEGTLQDENFDHPVLDELEARMMEGSGR